MDQTIGFIGAGNMGGAMIGGIVGAGLVRAMESRLHLQPSQS